MDPLPISTNIHPDRLPLPLAQLKDSARALASRVGQHAVSLIWLGQFFHSLQTLEGAAALRRFVAEQLRGCRGFSAANLDRYLILGRHGLTLQDGEGSNFGLRMLKEAALFGDERRHDLLAYGRGEERHGCVALERLCQASRQRSDPEEGRQILLRGLYGGGEPVPKVVTPEQRVEKVARTMKQLRQAVAEALANGVRAEAGRTVLLDLVVRSAVAEVQAWLGTPEEPQERRTQARAQEGGGEEGAAEPVEGAAETRTGAVDPAPRPAEVNVQDSASADAADLTRGDADASAAAATGADLTGGDADPSAAAATGADLTGGDADVSATVEARADLTGGDANPSAAAATGADLTGGEADASASAATSADAPAAPASADAPAAPTSTAPTSADASAAPPLGTPLFRAPRPPLRRDQVALPVGAPRGEAQVTPLELKLCAVIMAADNALIAADSFLLLRYPLRTIDISTRLAYHIVDRSWDYSPACNALLASLQRPIEDGQPDVQALEAACRAADPAWGTERLRIKPLTNVYLLRPLLPGRSAPAEIDLPLAWVVFSMADPTDAKEPLNEGERLILQVLGLLPVLVKLINEAQELREGGGEAWPLLCAQADMSLRELRVALSQIHSELRAEAEIGHDEVKADADAQEQRRAAQEAAQVTLGAPSNQGQHLTLGLDGAGRYITLTAETPTLTLLLGTTGFGKTYAMRVIAETAALRPFGLSQLRDPQLVIQMETDYHNGQGRRQMLSGFAPNPSLDQLEHLRAYYDHRAGTNEAYTHATLLAFPEALPALRAEYADLMERGLAIEATLVHPAEVGSLGYRAILSYAIGGLGQSARPAWVTQVESLIAGLGDEATAARLLKDISAIKSIDPRSSGPLLSHLQQMKELIVKGARLSDHLQARRPIFILLEARYRSPDLVLPFQVVLLHALCQRFGDDPFRWILIDEVSKLLEHPVIAAYLLKLAQELRHRPVSLVMNGQRVSNLPPALLGLASLIALFHIDSPWEFKKLQEYSALFRDVSFEEARALSTGQCLLGAVRASHPAYEQRARPMTFRPTLTCAGGETLRAR